MNSTTRYILTATAVGVGLFTVGATANALVGNSGAAPDPIGDPVVMPSAPSLGSNSSLEEVDGPDAEDLDDLATTPTPTGVLDTGGWATSPAGSGIGDDDSEHGAEIEGVSDDD
jgi:hypothetical protein